MSPVLEVVVPPARVGSAVARVVKFADGSGCVQTWYDGAWKRGGPGYDEVALGPTLSADELAALGIPAD